MRTILQCIKGFSEEKISLLCEDNALTLLISEYSFEFQENQTI